MAQAGSSALWASPVSKYDQVGVSLEPVKINSLSQFGSIDDVSDRLMKSERQKSSTLDVRIDKQEAVTTASGTEKYLLLYELQVRHSLDSLLLQQPNRNQIFSCNA